MKFNKPTLPPTHAASSSSAYRLDPQVASMRRRIRELTTQVEALEAELQAMRSSSSWRISSPLRWLSRRLSGAAVTMPQAKAWAAGYSDWVRCFDGQEEVRVRAAPVESIETPIKTPLFSIAIPEEGEDDGATGRALAETLESLRSQTVADWETLDRQTTGARGDWLLWLRPGDRLASSALEHLARAISEHPEARLLYVDDDQFDAAGQRSAPRFKPDWNPELLQAMDFLSSSAVFAKSLLLEAGGLRPGPAAALRPGPAAAYNLALRCIEVLVPAQIHHIPRILVHRSSRPADPAQPAAEAQALSEHLHRTRANAQVETTEFGRRVRYALPAEPPMVSLLIPTRNGLDLLRQCISSIVGRTRYPNYEILLVDNGSDDPQTLAYLEELRQQPGFTVIRDDRPFNFSALNNLAARSAKGEVLGLINNDIEVISPDWLDEMVALALQPGIGAVGAKLLYPDESIQHGGVLLGVGGIAGHANRLLPASEPGYMNRAMLAQCFSAVTAACLVVRKQLYEQVGGLDEVNLKIAYNDVDFCLRLRAAGHRTVWTPYAELFHHESATRGSDMTPEKRERFEREQGYMRNQWGELIANDPAYNPNLALDAEDFSLAWPPRVPWISGGAKP